MITLNGSRQKENSCLHLLPSAVRCENASANSDDRDDDRDDDHDVFAKEMKANRRSFNLIKSY